MKKTFWPIIILSLCLLMVAGTAIAFAQDGNQTDTDTEPIEPTEPTVIEQFLSKIGLVIPASAVIAFVTVLLGYLRNTPPEAFDITKFLGTFIFAILMGVVTSIAGWDYATAEAWLGQAGITIWVYWLAKVIAIRLGWLQEAKP